ncbi:MAG TPA: dihydropteroate synthase [Polyangia bacterium]|jgi:dihydropteroate synthase
MKRRPRDHVLEATRATPPGPATWIPAPIPLRHLTLDWSRTYLLGVLNVTPDSFSDGGRYADLDAAVAHGRALCDAGADILDLGGESTRPGAAPVSAEEELARVLPVLERLRAALDVPISIDTYKARVAAAALRAGADLVNDVSGGRLDPELLAVCGAAGAPVILGHLRGRPATMQEGIAFGDLVGEIVTELRAQAEGAEAAGAVPLVDPGLGFGKAAAHNLELIRRLGEVRAALRRPLCIGPSRKAFLGAITGLPPDARAIPSAAAAVACVLGGADLVRVHDVAAVRPAVQVADAIRRGQPGGGGR